MSIHTNESEWNLAVSNMTRFISLICKIYEYIKITYCVHVTMIYSVIQFPKTCIHYGNST